MVALLTVDDFGSLWGVTRLKLFQTMEETYAAHVTNVLPNIAPAGTPVRKEEQVIHNAAKTITTSPQGGHKREYGRNEKVTITNGAKTEVMKYKKAEPLLAVGGWRIVEDT